MLRLILAFNPGASETGDTQLRAFSFEDNPSGRHEAAAFRREAQRRGWRAWLSPRKFRGDAAVAAAMSEVATASGLDMGEHPGKAPGDAYWGKV
jgi:hypothetical protein